MAHLVAGGVLIRHLLRRALACAVHAILSVGVVAAQQVDEAPDTPAADSADVASIEAILAASYDVISGAAGEQRDWDRFRSLFIPGARLISVSRREDGRITRNLRSVEGYIEAAGEYFAENGFFERGIAERIERFGHIAHVFSTYEAHHDAEDAQPFARGINSFQLMNDGERWWVVTIFWEAERWDTPIPEKYLP